MNIYFLLLILVPHVFSEYCVTYDFEDEWFDELFSQQSFMCDSAVDVWKRRSYDEIKLTRPHPLSTKFIYPSVQYSCSRSWSFLLAPSGVVEVNIYMNTLHLYENVLVKVLAEWLVDRDVSVGQGILQGVEPGWHTLRVDISHPDQPFQQNGTFQGHVVFMSTAEEASIIAVDSFRYIPPDTDEEDCKIYKIENTSTESTTESTSESTSENTSGSTIETITEINTKISSTITIPTIEGSTDSTTDSTFDSTTESDFETSTIDIIESSTKIPVTRTTKDTDYTTSQTVPDKITKITEESTSKSTTKSNTEFTTESTIESSSESASESTQTTTLPTRPPLNDSDNIRFFIILAFIALLSLFTLIVTAMCICSKRPIVNNNNNHITITKDFGERPITQPPKYEYSTA